MFFSSGSSPVQPDALDEVLAVTEDLDAIMALRYAAVDRLREEFFAAFDHPSGTGGEMVRRSVRLELAAALRVTEHAAQTMIDTAEGLVHRFPDALEALGQGVITDQHARFLVADLSPLPVDVQAALADDALALAKKYSAGVFRRKLHALIEEVLQPTAEERHTAAVALRRVDVTAQPDGMASLEIFAPAVEIHAIHGRVTAIAKTIEDGEASLAGGDSGEGRNDASPRRTRDQIRADVACDLLLDGDTASLPPTARGIRPTVVVTVPALALLDRPVSEDARDEEGANGNIGRAGIPTVEGLGPIPLTRAKELCGSAQDWMRVLTHPETGMILSVGRDRYRPPAALRRLITWRSERCMAPGCHTPASRCEIDHTLAWEHGGTTSATNLAPLCKGHHTLKHHGSWHVSQIPDSGGVIQWTSPTGRTYLVEPERRTPAFTPTMATPASDPPDPPPPW